MEIYSGKTISDGLAVGPLYFHAKDRRQAGRRQVADTRGELERFARAKEQAARELRALCEKAAWEVGEENAEIFRVHAMILEDASFNDMVKNTITSEMANAEYAVETAASHFANLFSQMEDERFRERAADIRDVSDRVMAALGGGGDRSGIPPEPSIVAAEGLAPSETVQMERSRLLGFVTLEGSANSHTAILARTMGIPALAGIPVGESWNGKLAVLDGENGRLLINPDDQALAQARARLRAREEEKAQLLSLRGREARTASGKRVRLYANAGSLPDIAAALGNGAEGIGLFRSEFLYLGQNRFPTEEEQFQVYRAAAEKMAGRRVIIRTADIGADKQAEYFGLPREENPALGLRAVRICLERPEILRTQLRAILRAGAYGNVSVMYPMIASLWEVRRIREIMEEARAELSARGLACEQIEQGIMIETPAAAIMSDELATEVDFFSIGTNDLTQYALAADRQNAKLGRYYDQRHPAVLRLVELTVKNGHAGGCRVGICGELAADTELTETFVRMGIDELSAAPAALPSLRKRIREIG